VPSGKTIKLPFIIVQSNDPNKKKDPILFTAGGPGGSSLGIVGSIHKRTIAENRDFIAFEQRGTQYAIPNLGANEIGEAVKTAFRENLDRDSLITVATQAMRKRFKEQGVDLTAYTTDESAADIEDLRRVLEIDSLNLFGISYSGGLMMTVLKNYPEGIRSLVLDSPLPEYIHIDQEELLNFNEALSQIIKKAANKENSIAEPIGLMEKFQTYILDNSNTKFALNYYEKTNGDSLNITYSTAEIIGSLVNIMYNFGRLYEIPEIIEQFIKGEHEKYMNDFFDGIFTSYGPSGMRISVYCSDKIAFADKKLINAQYLIYPYMKGSHYYINDVTVDICANWDVPPISQSTKEVYYSKVPVLLGAGDYDPATRPIYNDLIKHYMPNTQRILFKGRSHGPMIRAEGDEYIRQFLDHPLRTVISDNPKIDVN
jgi:pimeloyl-ACP methyl ester carboxylesterase